MNPENRPERELKQQLHYLDELKLRYHDVLVVIVDLLTKILITNELTERKIMAAIDDLKTAVDAEGADLDTLIQAISDEQVAINKVIATMAQSTDPGVVAATTLLQAHHVALGSIIAGIKSFGSTVGTPAPTV